MSSQGLPSASRATGVRTSRSRPLLDAELAGIPWLSTLDDAERQRVVDDLRVVQVEPGELVCRIGRPVTYWFGVIEGLLKMSNDSAVGMPITFTGVPPGGWFGEGTVLKGEAYRYNIQALRRSRVAGISAATFHWLLDRSIGFNRFVMTQLNERLGQFIAAREIARPGFFDALAARTRSLAEGLVAVGRDAGVPIAADCEGGMFGFFFAGQLPQNYGAVMASDKERFNRFFHAMLERGVYLAPALYEAAFVSAAHSQGDIDATLAAARAALAP